MLGGGDIRPYAHLQPLEATLICRVEGRTDTAKSDVILLEGIFGVTGDVGIVWEVRRAVTALAMVNLAFV